tara:strand:- start:537 stop:1025 length:489 start_codon:yes stop_codon:yes gene_type:complete
MNTHLKDMNYVRSCYYLNPETQNARDNLQLCKPPQDYIKPILNNFQLTNTCKSKSEQKNPDKEKLVNIKPKKSVVEGMLSESFIVDKGLGESFVPTNKLPTGFEFNEYGIANRVCNNCSKPNTPLNLDMCFKEGYIYDGIDNQGNSTYARNFDDRFIKMFVL